MKNIKKSCIVVDSSACIKNGDLKDVFMVPLTVVETSNGQEISYKDLVEIDTELIINKLMANKDLKTSQSSLGEMIETLDDLSSKYDRIFVIAISSGISGSHNTWNVARDEFADKDIVVLDVRDIGFGIQTVVDEIIEMIKLNKSNQEIIDYVKERQNRRFGTLVVTDISQLKKGGRIGVAKAWVVDKLKLNIIISFDGALDFYDKAKSFDKTVDKCIEKIDQETNFSKKGIKNACVYTTFIDEKTNKEIKEAIDKKLNFDTKLMYMPSAIAVHTGHNSFSIFVEANK